MPARAVVQFAALEIAEQVPGLLLEGFLHYYESAAVLIAVNSTTVVRARPVAACAEFRWQFAVRFASSHSRVVVLVAFPEHAVSTNPVIHPVRV